MKKQISLLLCVALTFILINRSVIAADKPSAWAEAQINEAVAANLVPNYLQSQYTQTTTRAEFCSLAVKLYEITTGKTIAGRRAFDDTKDVNVEKIAYIGVVSGVGNNIFEPDAPLTREQAAVMLTNLADALGRPIPKEMATFADNNDISAWALESVGQVQSAGIMSGVGNNMFSPKSSYTREQSIVTILKLYTAENRINSSLDELLFEAVKTNNISSVSSLLSNGANPNYKFSTSDGNLIPLLNACRSNDVSILLLKAGADVNIPFKVNYYQNGISKTGTQYLIFNRIISNNIQGVKDYINYGARLDVKNYMGLTPREFALHLYDNENVKTDDLSKIISILFETQVKSIKLNHEYGPLTITGRYSHSGEVMYTNNISSLVFTKIEKALADKYKVSTSIQGIVDFSNCRIDVYFYDIDNRVIGKGEIFEQVASNQQYNIIAEDYWDKSFIENAVKIEFYSSDGHVASYGDVHNTVNPSLGLTSDEVNLIRKNLELFITINDNIKVALGKYNARQFDNGKNIFIELKQIVGELKKIPPPNEKLAALKPHLDKYCDEIIKGCDSYIEYGINQQAKDILAGTDYITKASKYADDYFETAKNLDPEKWK